MSWWILILGRFLVAGTPLLLGTLGEAYAERSGNLNLGVEGMMSIGAVTGFAIANGTGNPWLGFLFAGFAGGMVSLIHAFVTISLRANQVVSGLALTMFGVGLSGLLGKSYVGISLKARFEEAAFPLLKDIPLLGDVLFNRSPIFYLSVLLAIVLWYVLFRTKWGIAIRACGENPKAADAAGINVYAVQYWCVLIGGVMAGFAGAYLSLYYIPTWIEGMVAGRGWIVIALVILSQWNPLKAIASCYLFGSIYVLQYALQGTFLNPTLLLMLPYLTAIVVLIIDSNTSIKQKLGAPSHLGEPFIK